MIDHAQDQGRTGDWWRLYDNRYMEMVCDWHFKSKLRSQKQMIQIKQMSIFSLH